MTTNIGRRTDRPYTMTHTSELVSIYNMTAPPAFMLPHIYYPTRLPRCNCESRVRSPSRAPCCLGERSYHGLLRSTEALLGLHYRRFKGRRCLVRSSGPWLLALVLIRDDQHFGACLLDLKRKVEKALIWQTL